MIPGQRIVGDPPGELYLLYNMILGHKLPRLRKPHQNRPFFFNFHGRATNFRY